MSGSNPNLDPVQAMLAQTSLQTTLFVPNSRYYNLATTTLTTPDGTTIAYLQRRFCPHPERFQQLQQYTVMQGDRLDNISAKFLGDPTLFWRICDANRALRPEELTATVGRRLRITMPDGIAGTSL
jgi:hypothetical protein